MNVVHRGGCIALAALAAACGSGPSPSPSQPPPTNSGVTITGNERLGWTETGDGANGYVFAAYVDGVRNDLPQAACTASAPGAFACESPLPPLTKGTHTLQLSAAVRNGASLIEGAKSESIVVTVTGSGTNAIAVVAPEPVTAPGPARTDTAATALPSCGLAEWDPTHAIAWTSDGELALVDPDRRATQTLTWANEANANWRVAALASRVEGASRIVYVGLTSLGDSQPRLRVIRYRELNGVLGERAVLAEGGLPYQPAHAMASFGPDGRLFVTFAWATPSTVPRPFVVAVDPSTPAPFDLDVRFNAAMSVAATWDGDGRFWIVERSGDRYRVRSADTAGTAFAATTAIVGIEALPTRELALFTADGSGWIITDENPAPLRVRKTQFLIDDPAQLDAGIVSGETVVGCSMTPRPAFTYVNWRH